MGWQRGHGLPQHEWAISASHGVGWGNLAGPGGSKMASFIVAHSVSQTVLSLTVARVKYEEI